ncbi:fimbrial protein [Salmonella enterica]
MKPLFIVTGITFSLVVGSAMAADGTITFNGKVVDQTCSVDTASKNMTVTLPTVSEASLDTSAKTAALTPFVISISGCKTDAAEGAKKIKAYFEPNAGTDFTTGNLTNTASSDSAGNVQIQLLNQDGTTAIKLGQDFASQNVTATNIDADNVKMRYTARYYATGTATAGDVTATVNYTIAYE